MNMHSASHGRRKTVAGIGMVLAPLFFLASAILSPSLDGNEGAQLATIGDHMDRWFASNLLALFALIALVPAILGLMHMLRERETTLGDVGGGFALIGAMFAMGGTAIAMVMWQMASTGADRGEMTALLSRVHDTAGVSIPFIFGTFLLAVGLVVLAAGLMRAHAAHWTSAGSLAVGAALFVAGSLAYSTGLLIVAAAFAVVGFVPIGLRVLEESEEDWEHTPEVTSFRPLAGH
jgi:hypothetical protein